MYPPVLTVKIIGMDCGMHGRSRLCPQLLWVSFIFEG